MFHMGWFAGGGYSAQGWRGAWSGATGATYMKPDIYVDLARGLERACFDFLMIEDGSFVPDAYQGSAEWSLRNAFAAPKHDPMPLIPLMAQATQHVGLIATMTTGFYPPFLAARLGATLDHLTEGRVGLNLVTAHNDRTAQNYGLDQHFEHDLRYEIADEWIRLVRKLWDSWPADAILNDAEAGIFTDPERVKPIDFKGKYFSSRGPLNMPAGPQGHPVICQAGSSPAGRHFASSHADTIVAPARDTASARSYRDDIRERMRALGRDPDRCKIMFTCSIVLAETQDAAEARQEGEDAALARDVDLGLARLSFLSGIDFSKFPLDEPLAEISTNASRGLTQMLTTGTGKTTLREMISTPERGMRFVGTPDRVAAQLGEAAEQIGGDGFMITEGVTRRAIAEITDGLAPELKRRRLIPDGYAQPLFRENLLSF